MVAKNRGLKPEQGGLPRGGPPMLNHWLKDRQAFDQDVLHQYSLVACLAADFFALPF